MRNLKRVLSLALALVMVLGMMVIGTSAATFTDAEEVTYTEAVDVISALGIINGFPNADGSFTFKPEETLTREQGAKIVTYLLMGKEDADQLVGSGEFSDVAADRWSAGSIDYCAAKGILAGMGDGTFAPEGTLTIVQYAKMLLCALGYDAKVEGYVGSNWATSIVTDMIAASLKVKDVNVDAVLTREIAAQMTLQALEAFTVTYPDGKGTDIKLADGTTITIGAGEAVAGTDKLYETLTYATLTKDDVAAEDNGGLAGYEWNLVGATAPIYEGTTESVKASYASGVKFADIIKALGVKNTANKAYNVEVYRNGVEKTGVYSTVVSDTFLAGEYTGAELTTAATDFGVIPNGCTVDVVVTDRGNTIRLLVEVPYLAYVDKNSDVADEDQDDDDERYVTVTNAVNNHTYTLYPTDADFAEVYAAASAIPATSAAKIYYMVVPEGDPAALETPGDLLSIEPVTVKTGKMTSYSATAYTVDGKAMQLSATAIVNAGAMQALVGKDANYLLDAQGFVVAASAVQEAEADAVYAYLRQLVKVSKQADGTIGSQGSAYLQAELVFADGTTKIVTVATLVDAAETTYKVGTSTTDLASKAKNATEWTQAAINLTDSDFVASFMEKFVAYEVDEDGLYYLTAATNAIDTSGAVKDEVVFIDSVVANAKTVFVVELYNSTTDKTTFGTYTGFANLPVDSWNAASAVVGMTDDGVATLVYIVTTPAAVADETDGTVAFVTGGATFHYVDGKTKDYYEYPVLVDGAASTIKVAKTADALSIGLYVIETINANGYVTAASSVALTEAIVTEAANTIVKLGAGWKTYDANTVVTVIEDGVAKVVDIEDLEAGEHALYVTYVLNAQTKQPTDMIAEIIAVPADIVFAADDAEVNVALYAATDDQIIILTGTTYERMRISYLTAENVVIVGNGAEVVFYSSADEKITDLPDNLTLKDIVFTYDGIALEDGSAEGLTVEGCTFKTTKPADQNTGISFNNATAKNLVVRNCVFEGGCRIIVNTVDGLIVENCEFDQTGAEFSNCTSILIDTCAGDAYIVGNTIENANYNAITLSNIGDNVIEICENTLTNISKSAIRLNVLAATAEVVIDGNTMSEIGQYELRATNMETGAKITVDGELQVIEAGSVIISAS